ncbi:bifunctional DNA-formamidopyrimidine glycosylase/DNA-(apurinic or apyrimidinic site) lyase [Zymobacter sp. IVIA_12111.31 C1]|uniref:bifunctional DNA-formamidopyrimidine glycosylase/DNA-(apurinic or apyrimidinic site) lyase n=1 Tax=Zymobacter sp. IVIA_12111.31 C1 TaxID=3394854 RepID=UPI0039C01CFA
MPELPEVETTRRGIAEYVEGHRVDAMRVRQRRFRVPVPDGLEQRIEGECFGTLQRRAKYLLLPIAGGHLLWHLGMSGSLRLTQADAPLRKHDHIDLDLSSGWQLRYHDPRRFGFVDFIEGNPLDDTRLASLGPEPLSAAFTAELLAAKAKGKRVAIKSFIMDNAVVVGVGNIYANEALFMAGIDPRKPAGQVSEAALTLLVMAIKDVLTAAIAQGGTTLRDFVSGQNTPGYFAQQLRVYGRGGEPCIRCECRLEQVVIGQRATVFCPQCQR